MKTAIDAEKAKTVKIENRLKLENDRIKTELDASYATLMKLNVGSLHSSISSMESKLGDEKIKSANLSASLAGKNALIIYLRDKIAATNAKLRSEFEESQTVAIVADLKVKLCCRQKTIQSFKCELEHKDNVIKGLYALIESRKIDRY